MSKINSSNFFILTIPLVLCVGILAGIHLGDGQQTVQAQAETNQNPQRPPESQSTFYHRVTGHSFNPGRSTWSYTHTTKGCIHRNDADILPYYYVYDLQLPHGAEITTFNVYYYDLSPQDLEVELIAVDGAGMEYRIERGGSSAMNGYGVTNSGVFSHFVNNLTEALTLVVTIDPYQVDNLRFCGVRLTYKYNISSNYLPAMLNMASP